MRWTSSRNWFRRIVAIERPRHLRHIHEHPEFRRLMSILGDQLEEEIMGRTVQ